MARKTVTILAVAIILVLSGCSAASTGGTPAADEEATATPAATPTATPLGGAADNPWGKQTVTVALEGGDRTTAHMSQVVKDAIEYWNGEGDQYKSYPVTFEYTNNRYDADIAVIVTEGIGSCRVDDTEHALGCAPLLGKDSDVDDTVEIRVVPGLTYDSTLETVKHEFGHVVGKVHGADPMPLMAARGNVTRPPAPDATERTLPFRDADLTAYLAEDDYREAFDRVLEYYNGDETPAPDNVTVTETHSRENAHFVIEDGDCENLHRDGACTSVWGYDYDGQGELDWYTQVTITFQGMDDDYVAWQIGHWFATYIYNDDFGPFNENKAWHFKEDWGEG